MGITNKLKNIREYENLHIALWLMKDTCWVMSWKQVGMAMIIPTLVVAVDIAWRSRKNTSDLFHNIAVCLWISANATWMTGEFFYHDGLRQYAMVFFSAGIAVVGFYYLVLFPNRKLKEAENARVNGHASTKEKAAVKVGNEPNPDSQTTLRTA